MLYLKILWYVAHILQLHILRSSMTANDNDKAKAAAKDEGNERTKKDEGNWTSKDKRKQSTIGKEKKNQTQKDVINLKKTLKKGKCCVLRSAVACFEDAAWEPAVEPQLAQDML